MPDLPSEVLADLDEKDWQVINQIGEALAEESAKAQAEDQQTPEDSTEGQEEAQTEETPTETTAGPKAEPYMAFASKDELQEFIDERLNGRLERERNKATKDREKAQRDAKTQALKDQENYRELYEAEQARVEELEAETERLSGLEETHSTYKDTVSGIADARMEALNLPKGVKALVEGMEPADRLSWLQENEADFSGATETVPESPNGEDTFSSPEADEKARAEFAQVEANKF